jgi:hypothetical protein
MKKPKYGTKAWMTYIRSLKGKKGHTHKVKGKRSAQSINKSRLKHPVVSVELPKGAILNVRRKATNPYMMRVVDDKTGNVTTEHIWYSDDYDGPKSQ